MWQLHKTKVNLGFLINPFYLYCIAFVINVFLYLWGWSHIFPKLSVSLILFLLSSFIIFFFAGKKIVKKEFNFSDKNRYKPFLYDLIFGTIVLLGFINVLGMGYLPVLDRSHDYRDFGVPVLDPLFHSLSIFFSVFFFHSFLEGKKKTYLIYVIVILVIQILLFRRSAIVWILTSSAFLYFLYKQKVNLLVLIAGFLCLPLFSYCFGLYGIFRSNLNQTFVMNELGESDSFKDSGISHEHYMTYLYISSPLANLQKNIVESKGFMNNHNLKEFIFYSLIPESFTLRLEKSLNLAPPDYTLISPNLIAGSFLMASFYTMGWFGMISMLFFLFLFIILCLEIIKKWDTFSVTTFSLLSTTVSLLIFSNFLNRLEVILMLFIYPVLFHIIFERFKIREASD